MFLKVFLNPIKVEGHRWDLNIPVISSTAAGDWKASMKLGEVKWRPDKFETSYSVEASTTLGWTAVAQPRRNHL